MDHILPDEELIVIDGKSTDGSSAYLEQLYLDKKINYFLSEADHNQAEAWNKGFLISKGKIIKKIMDDDVFNLSAIRECKNWMLNNVDIDICISNSLQTKLQNKIEIEKSSRLDYFLNWQQNKTKCFSFSDVYMLIRKTALPIVGLYDTQFTMIDWEFSLRASFLKLKIAYYTGYNTLTVATPENITSLATQKTFRNEAKIAELKYGYPGDQFDISLWSKIKIMIGTQLQKYRQNAVFNDKKTDCVLPEIVELQVIYNQLYCCLEEENAIGNFTFIC